MGSSETGDVYCARCGHRGFRPRAERWANRNFDDALSLIGSAVPTSAESFVSQLRVRHDTLMSTRPEVGPGRFKSRANRAGIIVPIIWRDEYIANLRAMSRDGNADRYVRAMDRARRWTAAMDWSDPAEARARIHATNALVPPAEADERGLRLGLPT